jgi:type I restriction enzyme, S subunit
MKRILVGSTQVHIRNGDFFNVKMNTPTLNEQNKIADFLTAIDEKIAAVDGQLQQAEDFKKGLLQQMFV